MADLVIGGLAANGLAGVVPGASARSWAIRTLANLARITVWGFAIVIAVNQIGITQTLINTLFMAFVGALALGLGIRTRGP